MFKLIAIVYLLMNGQPVGDPLRMINRATFENLDACKAYVTSETGKVELEALDKMILSKLPEGASHTVATECEPAKDDGSI